MNAEDIYVKKIVQLLRGKRLRDSRRRNSSIVYHDVELAVRLAQEILHRKTHALLVGDVQPNDLYLSFFEVICDIFSITVG